MKLILKIAAVILLAELLGCESAEDHQHHLFNLQQCIAETNEADKAAFADDPTVGGVFSAKDRQGQHNYRAAQCMSVAEKTTIEFQEKKGDDYGKCAY